MHAGHQFYKCFGCGAAGDVLKFVMEFEHVSFPEALKLLAERNGIPMPSARSMPTKIPACGPPHFRFRNWRSNPFASSRRRRQAWRRAAIWKSVAYRRKWPRCSGWDTRSGRAVRCCAFWRGQGFTAEQLENSGVVGKREDGSFYDRFRLRLMFPIHSETGKVIAFGGRALDPHEDAKYINSADSPIYKKSAVLYNLHRAKDPDPPGGPVGAGGRVHGRHRRVRRGRARGGGPLRNGADRATGAGIAETLGQDRGEFRPG